jgi:hypothetical protein
MKGDAMNDVTKLILREHELACEYRACIQEVEQARVRLAEARVSWMQAVHAVEWFTKIEEE